MTVGALGARRGFETTRPETSMEALKRQVTGVAGPMLDALGQKALERIGVVNLKKVVGLGVSIGAEVVKELETGVSVEEAYFRVLQSKKGDMEGILSADEYSDFKRVLETLGEQGENGRVMMASTGGVAYRQKTSTFIDRFLKVERLRHESAGSVMYIGGGPYFVSTAIFDDWGSHLGVEDYKYTDIFGGQPVEFLNPNWITWYRGVRPFLQAPVKGRGQEYPGWEDVRAELVRVGGIDNWPRPGAAGWDRELHADGKLARFFWKYMAQPLNMQVGNITSGHLPPLLLDRNGNPDWQQGEYMLVPNPWGDDGKVLDKRDPRIRAQHKVGMSLGVPQTFPPESKTIEIQDPNNPDPRAKLRIIHWHDWEQHASKRYLVTGRNRVSPGGKQFGTEAALHEWTSKWTPPPLFPPLDWDDIRGALPQRNPHTGKMQWDIQQLRGLGMGLVGQSAAWVLPHLSTHGNPLAIAALPFSWAWAYGYPLWQYIKEQSVRFMTQLHTHTYDPELMTDTDPTTLSAGKFFQSPFINMVDVCVDNGLKLPKPAAKYVSVVAPDGAEYFAGAVSLRSWYAKWDIELNPWRRYGHARFIIRKSFNVPNLIFGFAHWMVVSQLIVPLIAGEAVTDTRYGTVEPTSESARSVATQVLAERGYLTNDEGELARPASPGGKVYYTKYYAKSVEQGRSDFKALVAEAGDGPVDAEKVLKLITVKYGNTIDLGGSAASLRGETFDEAFSPDPVFSAAGEGAQAQLLLSTGLFKETEGDAITELNLALRTHNVKEIEEVLKTKYKMSGPIVEILARLILECYGPDLQVGADYLTPEDKAHIMGLTSFAPGGAKGVGVVSKGER